MPVLYSNCAGCWLFDDNMAVVERMVFPESDFVGKSLLLEMGEWLDEERQLISRHSRGRVVFLGFKARKMEGVVFSQDVSKLTRAFAASHPADLHSRMVMVAKAKLKSSVSRDWLIIQASNSIEDIAKTANLLSRRLREWYELYNPEFSRSVGDDEKFVGLVLSRTKQELLSGIGSSSELSMGADLPGQDIAAMIELASEIRQLWALRDRQKVYLEGLMDEACPNTKAVAGALIGAKLIALSGSLRNLSGFPASTIQLLGAEKALFRHMKTGARAPKFGVLFAHPLIQKSPRKVWGKAARTLADKLAIAAKVDFFRGRFVGDKLMADAEAKFR